MTNPQNDPTKAGRLAGPVEVLKGRYQLFPIHTRFDAISWFVTDMEKIDALGFDEVIRQAPTREQALIGLGV